MAINANHAAASCALIALMLLLFVNVGASLCEYYSLTRGGAAQLVKVRVELAVLCGLALTVNPDFAELASFQEGTMLV